MMCDIISLLKKKQTKQNVIIFFVRHKAGGSNAESILVSQLQHGLTLEFENSDPLRRLRLTLSELLAIMNKVATISLPFRCSETFKVMSYCY